ncbi:MAG: hypothetical protein A3E80_01360 [Chlamydiae bacterium RIFCSPHIGHO2_12_FULL_49_9]|nr:MAG: hypothetical protein A3E80_01360 [Chlamydiae bacterium RIFCSPHIGHO2_12_FULL_49_9]
MKGLLVRLAVCLTVFGLFLYSYLDMQNELTQLKIQLPEVEKDLRLVREESRRLNYEIEQLESPARLIELAHHPEYSHLKHPLLREILTVPEAFATNDLP